MNTKRGEFEMVPSDSPTLDFIMSIRPLVRQSYEHVEGSGREVPGTQEPPEPDPDPEYRFFEEPGRSAEPFEEYIENVPADYDYMVEGEADIIEEYPGLALKEGQRPEAGAEAEAEAETEAEVPSERD